jgi:hypothetical protein
VISAKKFTIEGMLARCDALQRATLQRARQRRAMESFFMEIA